MEAVGQLTGGVAHDFNNLLTVIMGNLEHLERILPPTQPISEIIAAALRGASRAAILTHRLLAFSRRQPLVPEVLSVNKLVAGMSDLMRRTLGEAIFIETVLAGGLWPTLADSNQLENALINLAINARDAMPDGGKLTIETANTHLDEAYARMHDEVRARPIRGNLRHRYRHRDVPRNSCPGIRAVLHDQRNRPRARDWVCPRSTGSSSNRVGT